MLLYACPTTQVYGLPDGMTELYSDLTWSGNNKIVYVFYRLSFKNINLFPDMLLRSNPIFYFVGLTY